MPDSNQHVVRESLLQEGVSCALATVHVIAAAEMFRNLPAEKQAQDEHNHALWLLAMLEDHLRRIQSKVDEMDKLASARTEDR
ncbi:MAG TPA: hypothetical protein VF649_04385 [Sphingomonas sp.]|jgi:hypothetical protein|uniref:hypothetical protein n=1 Tax=Sphingomonas sp. TaxID=28214 RepID=UPI002ED938EA